MGAIIGFILSALSGVVGNSIYNTLTKEDISFKVTSIYNDAVEIFSKKYPDEYKQYWEDIIEMQENIDYIIKSFGYEGKEELNYNGFKANSFNDDIKLTNKRYIDDFIKILRHEISKDYDLGKLLEEKEHIIEQKNMNKNLLDMNNSVKETKLLMDRLLSISGENVKINFDEIMDIYNEKDPNEQEFKLITWLNNNNGHKEGVVLKAYVAYKQENWTLAYKLYKYIVDKYSEEFELNNTIGLICENIGKYQEAEKYFNLVLSGDPNHLNALFNLGTLYCKRYKNNRRALEYLLKANSTAPEDSEVLNNIGVIFKESHDYENAEKYFKLGIKYSKDNPLPFLNMGDINMDVYGDYNIAIMYFEKYLSFEHGEKAEIHNTLGLIYGSIIYKDKEKSAKHFNEAIKIDPFLNEARMNLSIIESGRGYFDSFKALDGERTIDLFEQGY